MRPNIYFMKVSRNDPFDLNLSVRGLGVSITYMHSDLYEYMYYLTFKRSMKSHSREFRNPWEQSIDHLDFFGQTDDPFVQNMYSATGKLIEAKYELCIRWGIDEEEDLINEDILVQSQRYQPYLLMFKRSKSYKKLLAYYERALTDFISCLYLYACAYTAQSFKIPQVLKKQFDLPEPEQLRLLNQDDNTVALLKDLISGLNQDLAALKILMDKKYKRRATGD
ncbi:hypothetical protein SAMN06265348_104226 [Pedobacter westerhofensis]|uniref:Uncharacterized protein n=2 Tax=Pedobacter westerhofensis TaxID=425512 RepID=A0A521CUV1_9SPHI|nr:hypothetical protein SAMN06265348_104226 [Pedobacter westerhofensis]